MFCLFDHFWQEINFIPLIRYEPIRSLRSPGSGVPIVLKSWNKCLAERLLVFMVPAAEINHHIALDIKHSPTWTVFKTRLTDLPSLSLYFISFISLLTNVVSCRLQLVGTVAWQEHWKAVVIHLLRSSGSSGQFGGYSEFLLRRYERGFDG